MELKHFSHNHALAFHQVPQGSQIHCSACKSPGSGNAYACWQCSYFLHEQCFRAARSVKHPSHPLHPLTLVPFPTYPSGSFVCNTCSHGGDGFSYTCSQCEFDIHVQCALMPSPNPHVSPSPLPAPNYNYQTQNPIYPPIHNGANHNYPPQPQPQPQSTSYPPSPNQHNNPPLGYPQPTINPPQQEQTTTIIKHFSHPHVLKSMEIEEKSGKACSACEWEQSGSVYCCTEPHCSFILDKTCFDAPREIRHKSHPQHPLTLITVSPDAPLDCYACWSSGKGMSYTCFTCSINLHIDCVDWDDTVDAGVAHQHELTLYYSAAEGSGEDVSIPCDGCENPINQKAWRYYCRECGVGVHTGCRYNRYNASGGAGAGAGTQEILQAQLAKMKQQQMLNDFRVQMAQQNAKFMISCANSLNNI